MISKQQFNMNRVNERLKIKRRNVGRSFHNTSLEAKWSGKGGRRSKHLIYELKKTRRESRKRKQA
jgi:hypothetical protein